MPQALDLTAWTATFAGIYVFVAGIGALRNAAAWHTMIEEVGKSPALQLVA
jgi:hypothetical protein